MDAGDVHHAYERASKLDLSPGVILVRNRKWLHKETCSTRINLISALLYLEEYVLEWPLTRRSLSSETSGEQGNLALSPWSQKE